MSKGVKIAWGCWWNCSKWSEDWECSFLEIDWKWNTLIENRREKTIFYWLWITYYRILTSCSKAFTIQMTFSRDKILVIFSDGFLIVGRRLNKESIFITRKFIISDNWEVSHPKNPRNTSWRWDLDLRSFHVLPSDEQ